MSKDELGNCHFNGSFRNAGTLENALNQLDQTKYAALLSEEKELVLTIFLELFDHQSFTGRSGAFYGYEGLGSIYWHMVSKLLLAAQECYFRGVDEGADPAIIDRIKDHYYEIKAGIGLYKSPELYGAFPTDAYSHTPANAGAQQPGMTGQVKEDFVSRMQYLSRIASIYHLFRVKPILCRTAQVVFPEPCIILQPTVKGFVPRPEQRDKIADRK